MKFANTELTALIAAANRCPISPDIPHRMIPLLDLTSLNESDKAATIKELCSRVVTPIGTVAAVCVYPQFVRIAKQVLLNKNTKVATVANFPEGSTDLEATLITIDDAINDGAAEIDVVMPYHAYLAGNIAEVKFFIESCKKVCGSSITLKVILEVGALPNIDAVYNASCLAIESGANFIKTSTGKITIGATLASAVAMLMAIKDSGTRVGFKASGGVRTLEQAAAYVHVAEIIMGKDWVTSHHFRIGASTLLESLLKFYDFNKAVA